MYRFVPVRTPGYQGNNDEKVETVRNGERVSSGYQMYPHSGVVTLNTQTEPITGVVIETASRVVRDAFSRSLPTPASSQAVGPP